MCAVVGSTGLARKVPINDDVRECDTIRFDSGDGVTVSVFFVDVANIEDSILLLKNLLIQETI